VSLPWLGGFGGEVVCYDRYFGGEYEEFEFGEEVRSGRFDLDFFFVLLVVLGFSGGEFFLLR
jgi:hypothetical protein